MNMTLRIEPIPFNNEHLEELQRVQADLARSMDDMIVQTFLAASRSGQPAMTRSVERRGLTVQDIRDVYDRFSLGAFRLTDQERRRIGHRLLGITDIEDPLVPQPSCAQCRKPNLNQTYTSTRDGREICAGCFEALQDKGLAREQGQPMKTKARHPLDAWMDE